MNVIFMDVQDPEVKPNIVNMRACVWIRRMYVYVCALISSYLCFYVSAASGREYPADPERRQYSNLWRAYFHGIWVTLIYELYVLRC